MMENLKWTVNKSLQTNYISKLMTQCTILRRVRVADRGFRSAGHAGISPVRGRWPRCFFSGKIC